MQMGRYASRPPYSPQCDFVVLKACLINGVEYKSGASLPQDVRDQVGERRLRSWYDAKMIGPAPIVAAPAPATKKK